MTKAIQHPSTQEAVRRYLDGLNALDADLAVSVSVRSAGIRSTGERACHTYR
jgi:hypothetical protein